MAKITLFKDVNFKGQCDSFGSSTDNLRSLNEAVSSVIVESGTWTAYTKTGLSGTSVTLTEKGGPNSDGHYSVPTDFGGLSDTFFSLQLNS